MKWVKVSDQKPEIGKKVMIVDLDSRCSIIELGAYFGDDDWTSYHANVVTPTHWMDLPNLPGDENG